MKIDSIDTSQKILIAAEIGNNHEGDIDLAKEMIDAASFAGVDAVKFQTFSPERYYASSEKERICSAVKELSS